MGCSLSCSIFERIDTNQMCIRMSREKILELKGLLEALMVRKKVKVHTLESLVE